MREEKYVFMCVESVKGLNGHLPDEEGNNDGKAGEVEGSIRSLMFFRKYGLNTVREI